MFTSAPAPSLQSQPCACRREGLQLLWDCWGVSSTDPTAGAAIQGVKPDGCTSGSNVCWSLAILLPYEPWFRPVLWELDEIQWRYTSSKKQSVQKRRTVLGCFLLKRRLGRYHTDTRVTKSRIWLTGYFWAWTVIHTSVSYKKNVPFIPLVLIKKLFVVISLLCCF